MRWRELCATLIIACNNQRPLLADEAGQNTVLTEIDFDIAKGG
ncbi:hypothetical protein SPBRAN_2070 [uncultured Candidatus Thioglobus sp.]|nr:hypothetical protein SPBRAN_2070 [uncultured Candidatus Thioglobus sp.]